MRIVPACAALGLFAFALTQAANAAAIVSYNDVGSVGTDGIAYTNIVESNNQTPGTSLFGQPVLSDSKGLWFRNMHTFAASSTDGASSIVTGDITFDVQTYTPMPASAVLLQSFGDFVQANGTNPGDIGGYGKVAGLLTLLDGDGAVFASAFLMVNPTSNSADYTWVGTSTFTDDSTPRTSFTVKFQNNLMATSIPQSVTNIQTKNLVIDFAGVSAPVPEPTSLGLLGLGVLGLMARRSRR